MNVELSPDTFQVVNSLVATGRYPSPEAAVAEGVRLLMKYSDLRSQVQQGMDDCDSRHLVEHDAVFGNLRGLAARIESESNSAP